MMKKTIIILLLLTAADYAVNDGAYVHAVTSRLKLWGAESSRNVSNSVFRR